MHQVSFKYSTLLQYYFFFLLLMLYNAINTDLRKIFLSPLKINYAIMHQNCACTPTTLQSLYTQQQCVGKSTVITQFVTFSQFRKYRLASAEKSKHSSFLFRWFTVITVSGSLFFKAAFSQQSEMPNCSNHEK